MALFDTNSGLGGLLGGLGDYGFGLPSNTGSLIGDEERDAINKRALLSGGINAALTYFATPKNLNTGSIIPYLGKAGLAGFNASQNTVDQALNTAYRNQILSARDDKLYNVDGALVDKAGKVVYQSPTKGKSNIGNVNPSDVTPASLAKFVETGNYGDLKFVKGAEGGLSFKDIYGGKPQLDVNGKPIFIPNLPGYPTLDANKRVVENVQLPEKAGEKLTEGERTAGFLSTRLNNSLNQLKTVTGEKPSAASPNVKAEAIRFFTRSDYLKNLANPESRQQVEAAQYDILDSALTLGTGAAYTREQLESYRQSYFPQLGDKPKTVEDKAKRLEGLLDAAYQKAGRAAPKESQPQPSMTMPAQQGWSIKKKSGG
jgi:hypothetical protein